MKLLVDMNLSPQWEETFEQNGVEAIHWSKVGQAKAPDREIMAWARQHGFVVFTNDLDFGHLLALTHAAGPSVIQVRSEDVLPESIGSLVIRALDQHKEALQSGALVVIDPDDFRARILPI
jgi:predicted nuclease of predicted toxin-antitoxin system